MNEFKRPQYAQSYISIDCVIFGFDGEQLNVLLVERTEDDIESRKKLPGSLMLAAEETDEAAERILFALTGIKKLKLKQFKCYSSLDRNIRIEDERWLEVAYGLEPGRLISVAYLALTKIGRKLNAVANYSSAEWFPVKKLGQMPFDHNQMVQDSLAEIRSMIETDPAILFELLPLKFTISELRKLHESIYLKKLDVRNFHKKIATLEYIQPLEERQHNVAHRAARYYRFNKLKYRK